MKKIFAANWKLNKSPSDTRSFFENLHPSIAKADGEFWIFPPATSWESAAASIGNKNQQLKWGAQNCYEKSNGAFTGENSAEILKQLGGELVLVGHSERRQIFGETDQQIANKIQFFQSLDLVPLLCIGETLQERESSQTNNVLKKQLEIGLAKADKNKRVVVAYEPVWAIGTGKVATTGQVAEAHAYINDLLSSYEFKNEIPILYGGSVKPDNAKDLISIKNVSGFSIGGASLEVKSLLDIALA